MVALHTRAMPDLNGNVSKLQEGHAQHAVRMRQAALHAFQDTQSCAPDAASTAAATADSRKDRCSCHLTLMQICCQMS